MKKYEILSEFFYLERCRLEAELEELQDKIRYRRISTIDCLELIIAYERLNCFNDISAKVKAILKIKESENDEEH
jgi:hypothetical protein